MIDRFSALRGSRTLAAAVVLSLACAAHAATFEKIAMVGDELGAGTAAVSRLSKFSASLGPDGSVIFDSGNAIWGGTPGNLQLVAQAGVDYHAVPAGSPSIYGIRAAANGQFVYWAPDIDNTGFTSLWTTDGATRTLVHTTDDWLDWGRVVVNAAGDIAFYSDKIYRWKDGSLGTVAETYPNGVLGLNDAGQVLYRGDAVNFFSGTPESTTIVGPWGPYLGDRQPFNDAGQSVFYIPPIGFEGDGLHLVANGTAVNFVGYGDAAPDTGGATFEYVDESPLLNELGQVVFAASLQGGSVTASTSESIWKRTADGELQLIVRQGDLAPGLGGGATFATLANEERSNLMQASSKAQLNNRGQILFEATDSAGGEGVWFVDEHGEISLVLRTGQLFDVSADPLVQDLRTIADLEVTVRGKYTTSELVGASQNFTDDGRFIAHLTFTDGSEGLFLATVPEPATFALLVGGGAAVFLRRRGGRFTT